MTREALIKHWDVIQAFKDGETIEYRPLGTEYWNVDNYQNYDFRESYEYRIKPEQTKRLPTIEEVEKWFLENRVFRFLGTEILFKIQSIDLNHSHRQIRITNWYSISDFCIQCEPIDGSELYITEK